MEDKVNDLLSYSQEEHKFSAQEADLIINALHKINVIDPACGSGAFPMGILQKILLILQKVDPDSRKWLDRVLSGVKDPLVAKELKRKIDQPNYLHKLGIIRDCIYGVDIQSIAVEISKLRFFLSLIVDEKVDDKKPNRGVEPLPNLEFKFVCANTLIGLPKLKYHQGSFEGMSKGSIHDVEKEIKTLQDLRAAYLISFGNEKAAIEKQFMAIQSKLFEHSLRLDSKDGRAIALASWKPFKNEPTSWFDPEWMFGIKDGFDIAIANPPYIQIQKSRGQEIQKIWQNQKYKSYTPTGDIYCLFIEKAIDILNTCGILTFITSNKWMRAGYGELLRDFLSQNTCPSKLLDFGGFKVFESATVDTNILIIRKTGSQDFYACSVKRDFAGNTDIFGYFDANKQVMPKMDKNIWVISSSRELKFKRKIETVGIPLKDWDINIYRGIITGLNEAFIINGKTKDELIAKDPKSAEIIKPILRGRDIKKYYAEFAGFWVILAKYGSHKYLKQDYQAVCSHLEKFENRLKARGQCRYSRSTKIIPNLEYEGQHHWLELDNNPQDIYLKEFETCKIIYPETTVRRSEFSIDTTGIYLDKTCFMITGESLYYLNAVLASKLMEQYLESKLRLLGKRSIQYSKQYIENIPIPKISESAQHPFIVFIERILAITKSQDYQTDETKQAKVKELEAQIDQMVYKLYALTPEEIKIVEGGK